MKNIKIISLSISCLLLIASCNLNEMPTFDDKDAFVAFTSSSLSVAEYGDTLDIKVLLSSLSGITTTIDFEIDIERSTAKEGVNFTFANQSHTLSFTKENPEQTIRLNIIDNETFDGDVRLRLYLKSPSGVNAGAIDTCIVTIIDDEHPLALILGSYTATGVSFWGDDELWQIPIEKDESDVSKVWIGNFVPGGRTTLKIYGVVNADLTEIRIPVMQTLATSYPAVLLEGFKGEDGDEDLLEGESITGIIAPDGTITIQDWFGSAVYNDAAATQFLGWFNGLQAGVVMKKN